MMFLIRADASPAVGSGHVVRMLALAQGLRRHGHEVMFLHASPSSLRARLASEGFTSVSLDPSPGSEGDAAATVEVARSIDAAWVIADGYEFSASYQRTVGVGGFRLLLVDDNGDADGYPADLVLNQSLHAAPSLYGAQYDGDRYLLGSKYVLLREEFSSWVGWERNVVEHPHRLLVTLGGLPNSAWLSRLIPALSGVDLDVSIAGKIDPEMRSRFDDSGSIEFLGHVDTMADAIIDADIGLTAGGGTTREFLFLGLPFAVIDVATNQLIQSQYLADHHLAVRLGHIDTLDASQLSTSLHTLATSHDTRTRMSRAGQTAVDGRGVDRVVVRLTQETNADTQARRQ